jgi:serine/threonine protein kinase
MAPEVITETGTDQKADIWSLGITCIEMTKGSPPHSELPPMVALVKIPKCDPPKLEGNYSHEFKDFVSQCLIKDNTRRPSATVLLDHPFVQSAGPLSELREIVLRYDAYKQKKRRKMSLQSKTSDRKSDVATTSSSPQTTEWDLDSVKILQNNPLHTIGTVVVSSKVAANPENFQTTVITSSIVSAPNVGAAQPNSSNQQNQDNQQKNKVAKKVSLQTMLNERWATCAFAKTDYVHFLDFQKKFTNA